jgi:hypothetical protein
MFGLFKKKSELDKLQEQYQKLINESYQLSHTDRKTADLKAAAAFELARKIEDMKKAARV